MMTTTISARTWGHDQPPWTEIVVRIELATPAARHVLSARRGLRGLRERTRERQRLAEHDRRAGQLAELHHLQTLIAEARSVIHAGWTQNNWFAYRPGHSDQRTSTADDTNRNNGTPVAGACLVGAIVLAGGGPATAGTQPVQRALDLTWHTLYRGPEEPVRWCPAPSVRAAQIRDLTRWNDHSERTADEVAALLRTAERAATTHIAQLRAEVSV